MSGPLVIDLQMIGGFCGAVLAMGALSKGIVSFSTKDVKRDVTDVERIVKLELRQENIEKGQAEIKADATRNYREVLDAIKTWTEQFSESIREMPSVAPKP
jgi:esterase/lipase